MDLILPAAGSLLFGLSLVAYLGLAWRRSGLPLRSAIRAALSPPVFPDPADSRRAGLFIALLQPVIAALVLVVPVIFVLRRDRGALNYIVLTTWGIAIYITLYVVARRGYLRLACWLLPAVMYVLVTLSLPSGTGSAGLAIYVVIIVTAGLLLDGRGALLYALLSSLIGPTILIGQALGWVMKTPALSFSWSDWLEYAAVYVVAALLVRLVSHRIEAGFLNAEQLRLEQTERSQALDRALRLERKRAQQLELLADSARRLTGINDRQALLDEAARRVVEVFNFEHAAVYLVDDDQLVVQAARGALSAVRPLGSRLPLGEGIVGSVGRTGETLWVRDAAHDGRFVPVAGFPVTSVVAVPLRLAKSVVGVLEVASTQPESADLADVRTLESLADLIAAGLQASQLFLQLRDRQLATEALRRIGAAVNQSLDLAQVVDTICLETCPAFDADLVELWLLADGTPNQLKRAATISRDGMPPAAAEELEQRGAELAGHLGSGRAKLLAAGSNLPDPRGLLGPSRSAIIAPLNRDRQSLGLLAIAEWRRSRAYTVEDAASAEFLGSHLAAAVANARLYSNDRRRANELALLSDITSAALEITDYSVLLDTLADRLGELAEADGCYLALWDQVNQTARLAAISSGLKAGGSIAEPGSSPEVSRLTGQALKAGRAVMVLDAPGMASAALMSLPLIADGQWLGAAHLAYRQARRFADDEIADAERAGRQIALAMSKARALEAERRRSTELRALHAASLRVTSSLDLRQVLEAILQQALSLAGGQDAHIFLYDGERLDFGAAIWADGAGREPFATPRRGGLTDVVAQTAQRIVVADVNSHPLYRDWPWGGAIVGLPLRSGDRVRGVMNVAFTRPRQFDEDELRVLDLLADQAAVALENARLFNAEREQRELAEALRQASLALSASLDFDTVLDRLLEQIGRVVPYDSANVMLVDGARAAVARVRGYEQYGPEVALETARLVLSVPAFPNLDRMFRTGEPLIVSDTAADPDWVPVTLAQHVKSWAGAPILAQGKVVAFFSLDKGQPGFYQAVHGVRLAAFVGQAFLALENARLFAAQRRRAEEQRLLLMAARDFSAGLSEGAVLEAIVRHMTQALDAASCTISLWDRVQDAVITLYDYLPASGRAADQRGVAYPLAGYPATRLVLVNRQTLTVDVADPQADPAERKWLERLGQARMLMVPLYTGEEVFGLVEIHRAAGSQPFREIDQQLALSLAAQAAVALDNARLHTAVQDNVRELDALLKANEALLSTLELDPLLHNILAAAIAAIPSAEMGTIVLRDPASQQLRVQATYGYRDPRIPGISFARDQGYSAKAMRENRPLLITDVSQEPPLDLAAEIEELRSVASVIAAPLVPKGLSAAPHGVISLDSTRANAFTAADLGILVAFANTAVVAIDNARLHAEVQRLAVTDSLTSLANPRAFEHALAIEANRAERYGNPLSLIIMDIDSFKQYNDSYGHPAGNERLKAIAAILRDAVRDPDLPVRYGGEEFALLLPQTKRAGALALAERIRELAQAAAPVQAEAGQPVSGYTLSLGVATLPGDALSASQLLLAADNAELQAKRAGKNRVCVADPLEPG